jgi:phosphoglycerol transferase
MKKIIFLLFYNINLILALFLVSLTIYLNRYFGEVSLTQVLFHLSFANNLIVNSEEYIIQKFKQICLYLPLFFFIFINFTIFLINKSFKLDTVNNKRKILFSSLFLILAATYFFNNVNFGTLKSNKNDIFLNYYEDPKNYEFNFDNSKNLVLIYVESYENIFSDRSLFGEDLLEAFKEKPFNEQKFNLLKQTTLTNWTIASILASQCGIPLKNVGIFSFGKNKGAHQRQVFGMKRFLPNANCLGDILKKGNYKNIFVSSPNLSFSGTGNFFKTHGYDELYGKKEFDELDIEYNGQSWGNGPNDSFLFEFSKRKIDNLIDKGKFNITILTTDTHEPNGFLDPNCQLKTRNIETAVKCTTEELINFIKYLTKNYDDKINIVILGDHQFRFKNNHKYKNKDRTIFNRFISNDKFNIYRNKLNSYDLFPTIVDFVNIKYNGNQLGLGLSGFKSVDITEYNERFKQIEKNILNRSKFYESFWKN